MVLLEALSGLKKFFSSPNAIIGNHIYIIHYRFTAGILVLGCVLVTLTQMFGKPIQCIGDPDSNSRKPFSEKFINTYCWIQSTFSLKSAWHKKVGLEVPYPGIDKTLPEDEQIYHAYYQWVSLVLLIQAGAFYLPYSIWKYYESGLTKKLITGLEQVLFDDEKKRQQSVEKVTKFLLEIQDTKNRHYIVYSITEILNLLNILLQMFWMDKFLNGQFWNYGSDVWWYSQQDFLNRTDPMIMVFPRVTKCTFRMFGESGDLEKHDTMCILPINIINEKIYIFLWFWFYFIGFITAIGLLYRLTTYVLPSLRAKYICLRTNNLIKFEESRFLIKNLTIGQWFLLTLILKNIDTINSIEILKLLLKEFYNNSNEYNNLNYNNHHPHNHHPNNKNNHSDMEMDTMDTSSTSPQTTTMNHYELDSNTNRLAEQISEYVIDKIKTN